MRDRNSSWRRMVRFLGLLLAFSATACNSGPTRPSDAELAALYTGKWRGNINGFELVLDIQARVGDLIAMHGTGTAVNPATGEIHRLGLFGFVFTHTTTNFRLSLPSEVPFGGTRDTGEFNGNVSRDGRTWPGRWTATNTSDGVPIFGLGVYSVTFIKD